MKEPDKRLIEDDFWRAMAYRLYLHRKDKPIVCLVCGKRFRPLRMAIWPPIMCHPCNQASRELEGYGG